MAFNCFQQFILSVYTYYFHFSNLSSSTPRTSTHLSSFLRALGHLHMRLIRGDWTHYMRLLLLLTSVSSSSSSHFGSIEFHSVLDTLLLLIINFISFHVCCVVASLEIKKKSIQCVFFVCQEGMGCWHGMAELLLLLLGCNWKCGKRRSEKADKSVSEVCTRQQVKKASQTRNVCCRLRCCRL